jgi:hypothetical protein
MPDANPIALQARNQPKRHQIVETEHRVAFRVVPSQRGPRGTPEGMRDVGPSTRSGDSLPLPERRDIRPSVPA